MLWLGLATIKVFKAIQLNVMKSVLVNASFGRKQSGLLVQEYFCMFLNVGPYFFMSFGHAKSQH